MPQVPPLSVLVCDLDDTLIKTDILFESVLKLVRTKPMKALLLPLWFARSKAYAKHQILKYAPIDPATLPYRDEVLRYLRDRRAQGSKVILASASSHQIVQEIADHCQCFDEAQGSSPTQNLKSKAKLAWINQNFPGPFEYIGDSAADLAIWQKSAHAVMVNPSARTTRKVKSFGIASTTIDDRAPRAKLILKQMRIHQWVKNALIAVPMIAAHSMQSIDTWLQVITGIASFSLIASMVYVLNDMLDVENDRRHPTKKNRPFAAGNLPLKSGFTLAPILGAGSFLLAWTLGPKFVSVIAIYFALNMLYSTRFKETIMLDVVILASFYMLRLMAGSEATGIPISHWLMSFSTFFFLGLAMVKRYTELLRIVGKSQRALHGRGYSGEDKIPVLVMGITCSLMSILILSLYFASPEIRALYSVHLRLWTLAPLMLFWNGRIWLMTNRGQIDDDPVVFAVKDKISWLVLGAAALVIHAAT